MQFMIIVTQSNYLSMLASKSIVLTTAKEGICQLFSTKLWGKVCDMTLQ